MGNSVGSRRVMIIRYLPAACFFFFLLLVQHTSDVTISTRAPDLHVRCEYTTNHVYVSQVCCAQAHSRGFVMADSLCSGSRESRKRGGRKSLRGNVKSLTVTRPACIPSITFGTLRDTYIPTVVEPPVPPSYSHLVRRRATNGKSEKGAVLGNQHGREFF